MEINATLVVQIIIFLALLTWLSRFLFQPFLKLFEEREKCIEGARQEAQSLQVEVQQKLSEIEERIELARREAKKLLLDLKAEGVEYQRKILDVARKETKEKSEAAEAELKKQVQNIKSQLEQRVPTFSTKVMERFLGVDPNLGSYNSSFSKMESRGA